MHGKVEAVSLSETKGVRKTPTSSVELVTGHGVSGDAHAGPWHRQVSLLAMESIEKMRKLGLNVSPGDFAENFTTKGINLPQLPIGTRLTIGETVVSVTQIGKECHARCAIFEQAGDCVMPREGIFVEVLKGGVVSPGESILVWPRLRTMVITLSDRCAKGETLDESGPALVAELAMLGAETDYLLISDDPAQLRTALITACDNRCIDVILTTGGTGLSPRDITPEVTRECLDKEIPGIGEAMRMYSLQQTTRAMLSRAVAGMRNKTLIINLPGSKKGSLECFAVIRPILPHAIEVLSGNTLDCGRQA